VGRAGCIGPAAGSSGRSNLGRARSNASLGSAAGTTGDGAQLGRARSSSQPRSAGVGSARPRRPYRTGGAQRSGPSPTTASVPGATRADLGIAPRRARCAPGTFSRWLGASGGPAPTAFVGRRGGTCPGSVRSGCDRLGIALGKPAASDPAGALVERAVRPFFVGCPQDRGAGRPTRTVVVRACRVARRSVGVVVIATG
jgi:hypothetical protein